MPQNQHFVHRSYLKGFADGEQFVTEYTINPPGEARRSTKHVFASAGIMNMTSSDGESISELESTWGDIEAKCGTPLQRVRETKSLSRPEDPEALCMTAALHWARGTSLRSATEQIAHSVTTDRIQGVQDRLPEFERLFEDQYGRPPEPGEVQSIVNSEIQSLGATNVLAVNSMIEAYNKFVRWVAGWHVELSVAPESGTGFSTSDSPLVIADKETNRVGLGEGLKLGEASLILMPVSRRLVCAFTRHKTHPPPLTSSTVALINKQLTWRNAVNSVVAHPSEDPSGVVPDSVGS